MAYRNNNQEFTCLVCNKKVKKLPQKNRDHCPNCLTGLHVDIEPGDRRNTCRGILDPIGITDKKGKKQIVFKCRKCNDIIYCIIAKDDNKDILSNLKEIKK